MNVIELFQKGGPTMYPLLFLSFLALTAILERLWFWFSALTKEREIVNRVLDTARRDWPAAADVARQAYDQPIGRFLYTPLQLQNPDPETFRLALEAAADEELASMRRGEKILEAVIALAPMLGLLGTVIGLIVSLQSIRIGDIGTASTAGVTSGIGEALISTASGLVIAVIALVFYRIFQGLLFNQMKIFRRSGNELELMYRQRWTLEQPSRPAHPDGGLRATPSAHKALDPDFTVEKTSDRPNLSRRSDDRDEKSTL